MGEGIEFKNGVFKSESREWKRGAAINNKNANKKYLIFVIFVYLSVVYIGLI